MAKVTTKGVLSGLYPEKVFQFFEEICSIPHGTDNTDRMSEYLTEFAKRKGLAYEMDEWGNVLIRKEATIGYENAPGLILQAHMDMVAVKNSGARIDLTTEGITPLVDGDTLRAKETSLGGDDGIGMAYMLAILDSSDIAHPTLEALFTTSEEDGMIGARKFDVAWLDGKQLLNLDSEEEGIFLAGCAGGHRLEVRIPVKYRKIKGPLWEIRVSGLTGGHSGTEIHRGGANAIILLGKIIFLLHFRRKIQIYDMFGGDADNVIPKEATARVIIKPRVETKVLKFIEEMKETYLQEFGETDPNLKIELRSLVSVERKDCLRRDSAERATIYFAHVINGVARWSGNEQGNVITSTNMGVLTMDKRNVTLGHAIRSMLPEDRADQTGKLEIYGIRSLAILYEKNHYPEWHYLEKSPLREKMVKVYEEMYGHSPSIQTIHAGLECGMFSSRIRDLDCVSIGPTMMDVHTTRERLDIASTGRVWEFLIQLLAALKDNHDAEGSLA
ncbi:MAG: beta-Ala-His dipeptidase [Lachnospiraceae bacterium]|nr:beta-Ala-His dipeptidase [Lachnospiraceae bacterium]